MPFTWDREPIRDAALSVVVTVGPKATAVPEVVEPLRELLSRRGRPFEVLLCPVSAGACDEVWPGAPASVRAVAVPGEGYGAALQAGILAAQYPLLLTFPGTGEYPADAVGQFLERIDLCDVVLGCRRGRPWLARLRHRIVPYLLFGLTLRDPTCPLRLYRREIFQRIPIQSRSAFAEVEILAKATFLEKILDEVEVAWTPKHAEGDGANWGDVWRVFNAPRFGPVHAEREWASATPAAQGTERSA